MKTAKNVALLLLAHLTLTGCNETCRPYIAPSINLNIYDELNAERVGCGANIKVYEDGDLIEEVDLSSSPCAAEQGYVTLLTEMAGNFVVVVAYDGYEPWESDVISVHSIPNDCNVATETVDAWLTQSN